MQAPPSSRATSPSIALKRIAWAVGAQLLHLAVRTVAFASLFAGAGLAYAEFGSSPVRGSIASALFIGGGAIVVLYGLSGGGARARIWDVETRGMRGVFGQPMPFTPVLVGFAVIGVGVLALYI